MLQGGRSPRAGLGPSGDETSEAGAPSDGPTAASTPATALPHGDSWARKAADAMSLNPSTGRPEPQPGPTPTAVPAPAALASPAAVQVGSVPAHQLHVASLDIGRLPFGYHYPHAPAALARPPRRPFPPTPDAELAAPLNPSRARGRPPIASQFRGAGVWKNYGPVQTAKPITNLKRPKNGLRQQHWRRTLEPAPQSQPEVAPGGPPTAPGPRTPRPAEAAAGELEAQRQPTATAAGPERPARADHPGAEFASAALAMIAAAATSHTAHDDDDDADAHDDGRPGRLGRRASASVGPGSDAEQRERADPRHGEASWEESRDDDAQAASGAGVLYMVPPSFFTAAPTLIASGGSFDLAPLGRSVDPGREAFGSAWLSSSFGYGDLEDVDVEHTERGHPSSMMPTDTALGGLNAAAPPPWMRSLRPAAVADSQAHWPELYDSFGATTAVHAAAMMGSTLPSGGTLPLPASESGAARPSGARPRATPSTRGRGTGTRRGPDMTTATSRADDGPGPATQRRRGKAALQHDLASTPRTAQSRARKAAQAPAVAAPLSPPRSSSLSVDTIEPGP